jgi:DeoR/GlpR family transcriptional regulator of sugar metabolism
MNRYQRKEDIYQYIKQSKICTIDELKNKYEVSLSTLHRDLNELLQEGRINKSYGQVAIKVEQDYFNLRKNVNVELKKIIAQKALEFVRDGDCIFLDNSTTVYYLAELLAQSLIRDVIVVSNSGFISDVFLNAKNITFVSTGGLLNRDLNCYVGNHTLNVISDFNADTFFLSCSAVSIANGLSDIFMPDEQVIKRRMHEKSKKTILLVDSTKIGKSSVTKWFDLSEINYIITDNRVSEELLMQFSDQKYELLISGS